MIHGNQRYRRAKRGKVHIAVVAMVPEQLLAFVGDAIQSRTGKTAKFSLGLGSF
jgi:hypothetical protein